MFYLQKRALTGHSNHADLAARTLVAFEQNLPMKDLFLPNYLINDLERVQKRALSIICPHLSYNESLAFLDMDSLFDHHSFLCSSLLSQILDDEAHNYTICFPQDIP